MFLSQGRCHGRILSRESGSASFPSAPHPPTTTTWSCTGLMAVHGRGRTAHTKGHTDPCHHFPGLHESHIQGGPATQGDEGARAHPGPTPETTVETAG